MYGEVEWPERQQSVQFAGTCCKQFPISNLSRMLIELLVLNIIRLRRLILSSLMKNLKLSCYTHNRLSQCQLLLRSAYIRYARRTSWSCMCYVCIRTRCKLVHSCRPLLSLHRVGRFQLLQKAGFYVANSTVISSKTNSCDYRLYYLKIPARIVTSWKYHLIFTLTSSVSRQRSLPSSYCYSTTICSCRDS
jgi:hypothetical protein